MSDTAGDDGVLLFPLRDTTARGGTYHLPLVKVPDRSQCGSRLSVDPLFAERAGLLPATSKCNRCMRYLTAQDTPKDDTSPWTSLSVRRDLRQRIVDQAAAEGVRTHEIVRRSLDLYLESKSK